MKFDPEIAAYLFAAPYVIAGLGTLLWLVCVSGIEETEENDDNV